ncbi:SAP30-binding protein-like isoform X2 [Senna tora]|uniref:SAP30-binding protein-like isoform X2 n=1 Tax=Senna tora TaxID=362788 RepID=A0A834W3V5_9FABA|nr:SAP30-binding protein-like isoform X2 [Senna tora]
MASKKKQSEGIALLSMYNDEEDDEMEDAEEDQDGEQQEEHQEDGRDAKIAEDDLVDDTDRMVVSDSATQDTPPITNDGLTPEMTKFRTSTPQQPSVNALLSPDEQRVVSLDSSRSRRGTLTIVDYGHDEVAMSPEPEDGGITGGGQVKFGDDLQTTNGDLLVRTPSGMVQVLTSDNGASSPQFSEPLKSDTMNHDHMVGSDGSEHGGAVQEEQKIEDPLHKFLPPPPKVKCSEELQRKINKFLDYKKAGKSFNAEVRNRKDYRNPDFLLHAVRYQDIDQIGSCFSKDVFDPHGYDPSDFYDEIEADMRRESDRKEQEKKKAQKVEFISGGAQPGIVAGAPRINIPIAGSSAVNASASHLMPSTGDAINRDGRQNKKSKWDKVDGDRKNPLPSVGQDSVSTVGAHAAILSAANAGGGYMLFAQQKRREAEEKRSSERKLESRS